MGRAIYPGSFDPITNGHCDIIRRIQPVLGEITVLVAHSMSKNHLFTVEERIALARASLKGIPGVTVDSWDGLIVDYLKKTGSKIIVRGLRAVSDFEYELVMANMNKKLSPSVETMLVFASPEHYYVSSTTVKEVALHKGSVKDLVPKPVARALAEKAKDFRKARKIVDSPPKKTLSAGRKSGSSKKSHR